MSLGQFIADEVVRGFILFKPEKIRFFGHDNWLVSETTRAFYGKQTGILICKDEDYRGVWKYDNGLLFYQGDSVYQVDVGGLFKTYNKVYQELNKS